MRFLCSFVWCQICRAIGPWRHQAGWCVPGDLLDDWQIELSMGVLIHWWCHADAQKPHWHCCYSGCQQVGPGAQASSIHGRWTISYHPTLWRGDSHNYRFFVKLFKRSNIKIIKDCWIFFQLPIVLFVKRFQKLIAGGVGTDVQLWYPIRTSQ